MIFANKNKMLEQYYELLSQSNHDDEILMKIENFKKYIQNRHSEEFNEVISKNQKGSFLAFIFYQYQYDRNFYLGKLKSAEESERINLESLVDAYNLLLEEIKTLMVEEQNIISRQIKKRKIEKFLTPDEIEEAKKQCSLLNTTKII